MALFVHALARDLLVRVFRIIVMSVLRSPVLGDPPVPLTDDFAALFHAGAPIVAWRRLRLHERALLVPPPFSPLLAFEASAGNTSKSEHQRDDDENEEDFHFRLTSLAG